MNDTYLDIHISAPPDEYVRGIIPAALSDFPFEWFVEDDRGIHCFIKKEEWHGSIETIISGIAEQYQLPFVEYISTTEIVHRNWNEEWEKSIQPVDASERFIITPSWHPIHNSYKTIIIIDPKMTFGTGYHETTRLMLRLMERFIVPDFDVLDIGTGTGILAIAAAKLGARHIIGVDIDEWSMENGVENAVRNGVHEAVEIRIGSLDVVPENNFSVVLANIIRNTILELIDPMLAKVSSNGTILLSGLLQADLNIIESALTERAFNVVSVIHENEWIALVAKRR